jgi:hypothetical protein
MICNIEELKTSIEVYVKRHPSVLEAGSEYIMKDDESQQLEALLLVADIFDNIEWDE